MQTFGAVADGAGLAACGFDLWNAEMTNAQCHVVAGAGVGGSKALRTTKFADDPNGETFPHPQKWVGSPDQGVFMSHWYRLTGLSAHDVQVKGHRAGHRASLTDTVANYDIGTSRRYTTSYHYDETGIYWELNVDPYSGESFPFDEWTYSTNPSGRLDPGNQINVETYYRFNTVSPAYVADGVTTVTMAGTQIMTKSDRPARPDGTYTMGTAQFQPGLTSGVGTFTAINDISRLYVDNTRARVFLGDSATLTECTGRFLLKPSEWINTRIVASEGTNIPTNYNWVYVMNSAGTVISNSGNGFAYANSP
jgi:hypothetical protein